MSDIVNTARDRDIRIENFAAELAGAVYPLVLQRGLTELWVKVELGLWKVFAKTVKRWARQRPVAASAHELKAWRESLVVDLTESAFYMALNNGIKGSLLNLKLGLYRTVRHVTRTHSRVRQAE